MLELHHGYYHLKDCQEWTNQVLCLKNTLGSQQIIFTSNYLKNTALDGEVVQTTTCW
jgi:hypothetical protein